MDSRLVLAPFAIASLALLCCGDDGSGTSSEAGTASQSSTSHTSNGSETSSTATSTSATTTPATDGSETTAGSEGSTTAGGGQPDEGMYAHCTGPEGPCSRDAPVCVHLEDDGFCTIYGCEDPAVDCAPAPADSTSVPICVDGLNVFCALSCEDDEMGCPAGMICQFIQYPMSPTYHVCF